MYTVALTFASAGSIAGTEAGCTEFTSTTRIGGWLTTIEQLAKIARVPAEERVYLRQEIAETVSYVNLDWSSAREALRIRIHRVVEARSLIAEAAIELQSAIADCDDAYGKDFRCMNLAPRPIDKLLNDILSWRDSPCLLTLVAAYVGPHRGRPISKKTSELWLFAVLLTANVERAGGRLTFDKNYPASGSLFRSLELLRPYVPWLIPQVIPIRTLVAVRRATRKALRDACERSWKMEK
jgi:hypothetical protein